MEPRHTKLILSLKWLEVKEIEGGILNIGIQTQRRVRRNAEETQPEQVEEEQSGYGEEGWFEPGDADSDDEDAFVSS
jgi:hypothetical protein